MAKAPITLQEFREEYIYLANKMETTWRDQFDLFVRMGSTMDAIQTSLTATQVGLANVYNAFEKSQEAVKKERQMLEDKQLELTIKSYPMNVRIKFKVETNFGEIDYAIDFPPISEMIIGSFIQSVYDKLLNELYDAHEARGGLFIGQTGCKDWMEKNGRTVLHKEPSYSTRFDKPKDKENA